jgi:hypothetical protein
MDLGSQGGICRIAEFAFPRCPYFLAKIDDLHLKSKQNGRFGHSLKKNFMVLQKVWAFCQIY